MFKITNFYNLKIFSDVKAKKKKRFNFIDNEILFQEFLKMELKIFFIICEELFELQI